MLRTVKFTHRGDDVLAIQQGLNRRISGLDPPIPDLKRRVQDGLFVEEDSKFGEETQRVVKAFQRRMGLVPDGEVGYHTRKAIFPLGLATLHLVKLRMPELRVPGLRPNLGKPQVGPDLKLRLDPFAFIPPLGGAGLSPVHIPGLPEAFMGPPVEQMRGQIPLMLGGLTLPGPPNGGGGGGSPGGLGMPPISRPTLVFDRAELAPGGQTTFNLFRPDNKQPREDALVLTLQFIYRRGPSQGPHQELSGGLQMGVPLNARDPEDRPINLTPFLQVMDVDRLGSLGQFHFWQPYAQIGGQFSTGDKVNPTLTLQAFPVNLGLDLGKHLSLTLATGGLATYNFDKKELAAGIGLSFGISAKSSAIQELFVVPPLF